MPGRSREGNRMQATHPATTAGPGCGMKTNRASRSRMKGGGEENRAGNHRGGEHEKQQNPINIC